MPEKKIGILVDEDFALLHFPPYPKPSFISFENPQRIRSILDHLDIKDLFKDKRVQKLNTIEIEENLLLLAHTKYHIEAIKRISNLGGGFLGDEVFITENSFNLSKKAVGGCIVAVESVLNNEVTSSFALVRPPGHHALRETSSGLCIFNNIAVTIQYLREIKHYNENIAIIDIDNHFGDGLAQYFYDDPSVLYFSIHEYDFMEGDIGLFNELGQEEGLGRNINFPVPPGICNEEFLELFDIIEPILFEFKPGLILIAAGFDMYHADPIGNCRLTSKGYQEFSKRIALIAEKLCDDKLVYILEGGYSTIGLSYCVLASINGMLDEDFSPPEFELNLPETDERLKKDVLKIKNKLIKLLSPFWQCFNVD